MQKKTLLLSLLVFGSISTVLQADMTVVKNVYHKDSNSKFSSDFEPIRVAVINPQVIIEKALEWVDRINDLKAYVENKAADLQKQAEAFMEKRKNAKPENHKDLAKEQTSIEIEQKALEQEAQNMQQVIQMDMMNKVDKAVTAVAKEENLDIVLPKFFYASERADMTDKVIEYMNKEYKKEKSASKFKKKAEKSEGKDSAKMSAAPAVAA